MEFIIDTFRADWEALLRITPRLVYAAIVLVVVLAMGRGAGKVFTRLISRHAPKRSNLMFVHHLVTWTIGSIGILLALGIMGFQGLAASMLATGGVVAIVAGFAFREIGENFLAGFFLSFSRPFEIKDLIQTGDLTGTVSAIELRYVHIRTFDGCDVFVPSAQIFREPLYNFTRDGLRRPVFTIGVAYHDSPEQVVAILERATSDVPGVLKDPAMYVSIKEFGSQYIEYQVFFWIDVTTNKRGFINTRNDVKISCWKALTEAGMTFSTDITSGIDIKSTPEMQMQLNQGGSS